MRGSETVKSYIARNATTDAIASWGEPCQAAIAYLNTTGKPVIPGQYISAPLEPSKISFDPGKSKPDLVAEGESDWNIYGIKVFEKDSREKHNMKFAHASQYVRLYIYTNNWLHTHQTKRNYKV